MSIIHPSPTDCAGLPPEGRGAFAPQEQDEELELAAATWAVRCREDLDAESSAALNAWLAADPRHASALAALSATLQGVQQMPAHEAAKLRAGLPRRQATARNSAKPSVWQSCLRPLVPHTAAAAVVLAIGGVGWFGWWVQPTFEQSYASERGQQLVARLPDDEVTASTMQLDSATQLQARLFRDRREVELRDGQAMFTVHSDKTRPFHVLAGGLRITVIGTRFSVRHTTSGMDAGRTVVAVEEGRVRVERAVDAAAGAPMVVELAAGQVLEGADSADVAAGLGTVSSIAPAAVAQWRSGRISFNQTPLDQALAEFERYGYTGLVVHDPVVAAMPVGGSYGLGRYKQFAEFLPQLLPVRLVQRGGVTEIVAR